MRARDITLDLSAMVLLEKPLDSRNPGMVLRVTEKNFLSMNRVLLREIKEKNPSMLVKFYYQEDYKVIALQEGTDRETSIKFHADGMLRHTDFVNQLREAGYQIPAKYNVEWNEREQAWVGILEEVPELKDAVKLARNATPKKNTGGRRKTNVKV